MPMSNKTIMSAWLKRRKRLPVVAIGTVTVLLAALEFAVVNPAQATPAKPWTDWGYYMLSTSTTTAYNLGCNQGNTDRDEGDINSEEFLDFGVQKSGNINLMINSTDITDAQIESVSEQFAYGYWVCTGSDTSSFLTLAVGTNNDTNGGVDYGATWATVTDTVASWVNAHAPQVVVDGGDDIEPSWETSPTTIAWANGFSDNASTFYLDYGSADGCPESSSGNGPCNNGWDQYDVWYVAYGAPAAMVAPEIYSSGTASEWTELCLYGAQSQSEAITFQGPLDDNALDSGYLTSSEAWSDLWNALNAYSACAQTPLYSLEVHDE